MDRGAWQGTVHGVTVRTVNKRSTAYMCVYVCMYICVYIYTYAYIHSRLYIYIYTLCLLCIHVYLNICSIHKFKYKILN